MGSPKGVRYRTIELLCQECHGGLVATTQNVDTPEGALPVWICADCRHTFVYTDRGWVRQEY